MGRLPIEPKDVKTFLQSLLIFVEVVSSRTVSVNSVEQLPK